jgi:hypothetical protein
MVRVYSEPGKTLVGSILIIMGMMILVGGLQLEGYFRLLAVPGPFLGAAVFYDQVLRNLRRKG